MSFKRFVVVATCVIAGAWSASGRSADTWLVGTMSNITSGSSGLLIQLDTGVPGNCTGTAYGWMLIAQENKAMLAVALTSWTTGNRQVTVYTSGIINGVCVINQFDPV